MCVKIVTVIFNMPGSVIKDISTCRCVCYWI